jgi:hypothetical protein
MRRTVRFGVAALATAALLVSAPQAFAGSGHGRSGGDAVRGRCSGASTSKIKASPNNNQIEVDFEVDQNVVGDTWRVVITDNGLLVFRGTRVTQGTSGSFEVRKLIADQAGADAISARAKNLSTGEVCKASITA